MPLKVEFRNDKYLTNALFLIGVGLFLSSHILLMHHCSQKDFFSLFPLVSLAFLSYILLVKFSKSTIQKLTLLGIIVRCGMILFFPNLSDDIYRFYWDGLLLVQGVNPYGILPTEVLLLDLHGLDQTLFSKLNSQHYYTIYPPISQLYFGISALGGDLHNSVLILKSLFLLTELAGLYFIVKLLLRMDYDPKLSMIYFLNPLVIIEGIGNLHFEVLMVAFLAGALYFLFSRRYIFGGIFLAIGIGIKLLPLMILPYFVYNLKSQPKIRFFGVLVLCILLIFLPLLEIEVFQSLLKSIDLYFRKFEFNASMYYILRWLGKVFSGYNLIEYIGPILGILTISYNIYLAKKTNADINSFFKYAISVWFVYLILATTVHPWYIITLVFFSIFMEQKWAIVWSFLVFLTYINYSYPVYTENLWFIGLEYCLLILYMFYEKEDWLIRWK